MVEVGGGCLLLQYNGMTATAHVSNEAFHLGGTTTIATMVVERTDCETINEAFDRNHVFPLVIWQGYVEKSRLNGIFGYW